MKIRSILVSMLAIATLAGCNKDDESAATQQQGATAYLSVALDAAAPGTYANPTEENGTSAESKASEVLVVAFENDAVKKVITLSTAQQGTIGGQGTTAVRGDAFEVPATTNNIFVVINPTAAAKAQIAAAATYAAMNLALTEEVSALTVANKFMMTSAGAAANDKGLTVVTPSVASDASAASISAAKSAAEAAPASIKVDRTMAKTKVATFAGTVENGVATLVGYQVNVTNKNYLPYAEIVDYVKPGTYTIGKYRHDANWTALTSSTTPHFSAAFNWLHNWENISTAASPIVWKAINSDVYVHENTMEAAAQDYNNTTKWVIKATFTPTGKTPGSSWFRMNGVVYTLAELQALYAATTTPTTTKDYMDAFYTFMNAEAIAQGNPAWTSTNFSDLTITELDAIENGGYAAAKIFTASKKYLIEYFQNSVCYYEVNINHDHNVLGMMLGRWGVVRNNYYTLDITKISKPGKPYIPDPIDPDITDPENPDPDDPEDDDEPSAYLSVKIEVNPWTAWTQQVEL